MEENNSVRRTHILVECPELIASVRVGVLAALEPLAEASLCTVRFRETRNIRKEDIVWCDICVCVRGSEYMTYYIVRELKRLRRLVFYFLDDDLLHLPEESLAREYFDYGGHQKALCDILGLSDGLWGANVLIRDDYLSLCGVKRWICTRMPISLGEPINRDDDCVRILYAGSVDHQNIVREILAPAVEMVTDACGSDVEFTFIGPNPNLPSNRQVKYVRFFEDYDQYRKYVLSGGFDIGLATVKLAHFFQCKYYNKFVEYTSIGAVGVYTDCPLYRQIVVEGKNGLLCENTPQAWAEAIIRLVRDVRLRHDCYENAALLIARQFTPKQVARELLNQMPEIVDFRAPSVECTQIRLYNPLVYFYIDRIRYLFHQYRLLAIPVILWKAVKKIIKWVIRGISC